MKTLKKFLNIYFSVIRQILPQKKESNAVGIDIGTNDCKLVELSRLGSGFQLVDWAIQPISNGDLAGTLTKLIRNLEKPTKSIYTAVSGKGTLIRYIDMPVMSLDDLKKSFALEADKYLPFAQDEIYIDCCILSEGAVKGKQMAVMAAASKKDLVDHRMKLLTDLGLQVDFVGLNPTALANTVNVLGFKDVPANPSGAIALLDMGDTVSNLSILVNKSPRFTRDIFMGGRDLSKRISNVMGISFEAAEQLKGNPGDKLNEVLKSCDLTVTNIVQEIRLSFDYFMTERNMEIQKLYLTGGGSLLQGITQELEKNLNVSVAILNPFESLTMGPNVDEQELNKVSRKLGVALGLALYAYD